MYLCVRWVQGRCGGVSGRLGTWYAGGGFWVDDLCWGSQGFFYGSEETGCVGLFDGSKFWFVDRFSCLGVMCAQKGAEKASGTGVWSAWGGFARLAPVLPERETCLFGAGLIPVFDECWCVVARQRFWSRGPG